MESTRMKVIKRNGRSEPVSFDKVTLRIQKLCEDLGHVDPTVIAQKVGAQIYDGVHTWELDELASQICASMITEHLDYGELASRIIISNNHKNTSPSFSETMTTLYENQENGKSVPRISRRVYDVVLNNREKLNDVIDYQRDYTFDYFSFKTLERAYLTKVDDRVVERIQDMWMRVAVGLHHEDIPAVIETYHAMSQKYFTHATPTLFNAGTDHPQLSSCFLLGTDDSIEGIYKTISDCARISKWAGGIGVHIHNIRSSGSVIRGTGGKCTGIVPMCRVYNDTAKYVNQGGRRPGSIAMYLEPHHPEILKFLDLRKNHGNEDERARELFLAVWLSDLFMERVQSDSDWTLFDPDDCPDLCEAYGEEYRRRYLGYEQESGRSRGTVRAREIWDKILESQIETGSPYVLFKDNVNRCSNQANVGTIRSSNLCAEICLYSDNREYAVCNLASMGLPRYVDQATRTFDFETFGTMVAVAIRNLNKVIDLNYYPVPETELSNLRHRPVGLGVQGLADVYSLLRMPFDSEEAMQLNKEIFEAMYYAAVRTSCELAKVEGKGPYDTFRGSPISQGQFQFDLWGHKPGPHKYSPDWDWEGLRADVRKHGVRNSLLIALMPTASTSQILGNNECFEPYTSNIYTRRTIAGDFVVMNKHLVRDLMDCGLWTPELKDMMIANNGSIQNIAGIPDDLKALYKTAWELKQKVVIQQAIDRGPFVCHSQSLNLFFEEPDYKTLSSALFYGWKGGLKTGSYYIRTRPSARPQQFTLDPEFIKKVRGEPESDKDLDAEKMKKLMCSIQNKEACEMCSG